MFNWQNTRKKARQAVHNTFAVPGILINPSTKQMTKALVRLSKKVEWAGEDGAQYQVENIYAYIDTKYVDNLYRNDEILIQESNETYRVTNTLPKKDGYAIALVIEVDESQ